MGVLAFKLLSGNTPFNQDNNKSYEQCVLFDPPDMSKLQHLKDNKAICDLIIGFLEKDGKKRMGKQFPLEFPIPLFA